MIAADVKYKKTGIDWMPEVPEHWEIRRLGSIFKERKEKVSEDEFSPLSVTKNGILPQLEGAAKTSHTDNRKKVCIGDFAVNSRSDRRGSGGVSGLEGAVSIVNTVLKPSEYFEKDFTHYLLTCKLFQDEFYIKGKGIVADMWSTKFSEMKTIYLPIPPIEEQRAIADYLDDQSAKISNFIQTKQRFIELLKEERQGIITNAVTKGIDEGVKMKETGINWMPEVPEHWELRRMKYLVDLYKHNKTLNTSNGFDFKLALENIDNWTGKYIESVSPDFEGEGRYFKEGDVLFGKLRPYLAKAFLPETKGICVSEILVLTPNSELITSEFLFQRILTKGFIDIVDGSTYGAKMPRASWDFIGNMRIAFPPTIEEQKHIVEHIKTETRTLDIAISKAEREIELIKEYREAMIAEAVSGKMKL